MDGSKADSSTTSGYTTIIPVADSSCSSWKMPNGSPLRNTIGPRRKRPRSVQGVRICHRLAAVATQAADHTASFVPGQGGEIFNFQPELGPDAAVSNLKGLFGMLPNLAALGARKAAQIDRAQAQFGPEVAER